MGSYCVYKDIDRRNEDIGHEKKSGKIMVALCMASLALTYGADSGGRNGTRGCGSITLAEESGDADFQTGKDTAETEAEIADGSVIQRNRKNHRYRR